MAFDQIGQPMRQWLRSWWVTLRLPRDIRRALCADYQAKDFEDAMDFTEYQRQLESGERQTMSQWINETIERTGAATPVADDLEKVSEFLSWYDDEELERMLGHHGQEIVDAAKSLRDKYTEQPDGP